jgi:hypothetical protein
MTDVKNGEAKDDDFLAVLEKGVRDIIKNRKSSKADRLSAINAGVKVAQIRHRINGGDDEKGFFGK